MKQKDFKGAVDAFIAVLQNGHPLPCYYGAHAARGPYATHAADAEQGDGLGGGTPAVNTDAEPTSAWHTLLRATPACTASAPCRSCALSTRAALRCVPPREKLPGPCFFCWLVHSRPCTSPRPCQWLQRWCMGMHAHPPCTETPLAHRCLPSVSKTTTSRPRSIRCCHCTSHDHWRTFARQAASAVALGG